jgi:hypothetical protein
MQGHLASKLVNLVDASLLVLAWALSGYSHMQRASSHKPTGYVRNLQRWKMEAEDGSAHEGTGAAQHKIQEKSIAMRSTSRCNDKA